MRVFREKNEKNCTYRPACCAAGKNPKLPSIFIVQGEKDLLKDMRHIFTQKYIKFTKTLLLNSVHVCCRKRKEEIYQRDLRRGEIRCLLTFFGPIQCRR